MVETINETAKIEAEIRRDSERLEVLNQKRGELVFAVRNDPARGTELGQVREEIAEAERDLAELQLAKTAASEKEKSDRVAAREAAVRKLAEMLEDFDRAYEKLLAEISEGGTDPSILGEVDVLSRQVSSLGHDLLAATGDQRYRREWNLRGQLIAGGWAPSKVQTLLPSLCPGGGKPVVPRPWQSLIKELEILNSK